MQLKYSPKIILFIATIFIFIHSALAQEKKVAATSPELFVEIAKMDSILFDAFNTQNMVKFKSMFTTDLEWFQDNDGLVPYETVFKNFETTFKKEFKLTRQLVKGSLEVHPLKNYGAIEIGSHQFRHIENGKQEVGTFRFVMLWQKKDDTWKISRVISYDH
ncbi:MAG: nuclear transport factor 2 family protein [Chitinophagaceae bacterium]|nr:nuclear transport factor 2 family protein [Chitinophagaceae bacterium]